MNKVDFSLMTYVEGDLVRVEILASSSSRPDKKVELVVETGSVEEARVASRTLHAVFSMVQFMIDEVNDEP